MLATREGTEEARGRGAGEMARRPIWHIVTLGAIAVAVTLAVLLPDWGGFAPDTKASLYLAPFKTFRSSLSAWNASPYQAGYPNFNTGFAPVAAAIWLIRGVGTPAWLAVRVWRLVLLLTAGAGMYRCFGRLADGGSPAGRLAATTVYVLNPYVVVQGGSTPILLPYALLPWLVLATHWAAGQPRSWRGPAAIALVIFLMGGLNAGVVTMLMAIAIPVYLVYERLAFGSDWANLWRIVWRAGVLCLAVSLYWLLPSLLSASTGAAIVATTENPRNVASTSSYAEVVRLLGIWPLYGRQGTRLFDPGNVAYVTNPAVVVASFAIPGAAMVSALLSRARARLFAVMLLVSSIPLMVGLFPVDRPTPLGHALDIAFRTVPVAGAFRTTNKLGALVALAFAVLIGLGAAQVARRAGRASWTRRATASVAAVAVLATATFPVWSGRLYPQQFTVPGYWYEAATALDAGPADSRVLFLPGEAGGNYRWGPRSAEDQGAALLDRPTIVRSTVSTGSVFSANFLAAFDVALNTGSLSPGVLSAEARLLGASDVLVRNDTRWEEYGAASPSELIDAGTADPGLTAVAAYGRAGLNTTRGAAAEAARPRDAASSPLVRFAVEGATTIVRAEAASGTVLVDGDAFALPALLAAGLVEPGQPIRYIGEMSTAEFEQGIADGARVVLTDTNRRREWGVHGVGLSFSPTLTAAESLESGEGPGLTLFGRRTDRQTVTRLEGVTSIEATKPVFGRSPSGKPFFAFDGDPTTMWQTGGFGSAVGSTITLRFSAPRDIGDVVVQAADTRPVRIASVEIQAGDRLAETLISGTQPARVTLDAADAESLSVRIAAVAGQGVNPVGLAEINVSGLRVNEVTALPTSYAALVRGAGGTGARAILGAPLDVVLTRQSGDPASALDDEERAIDRVFTLPQQRAFRFEATAKDPNLLSLLQKDLPIDPALLTGCYPIAFLDARPLMGRLAGVATGDPGPYHVVPCRDDPMVLGAGTHRLTSAIGWILESVHLASAGRRPAATAPVPGPAVDVLRSSATSMAVDVAASDDPYYLVTGQSFDARWRARVDGHDLGRPSVVDGYAAGWRLPPGPARHVEILYAPQRVLRLSLVLSALGFAAVAAMLAWTWLPSRRGAS